MVQLSSYLLVVSALLGSSAVVCAVENRQNVCLKLIEHHCGGSATPQVMESCVNDSVLTCAKPKHCLLPAETGMCRAAFPKFYYNQESNSCENFIYGGCGGNENNFNSEKECNAACSGVRYCGGGTGASCPKMFECTELGEGEVGTCVPATPDRNSQPTKHKKPLKPQTKPLRTKPKKEKVPLP